MHVILRFAHQLLFTALWLTHEGIVEHARMLTKQFHNPIVKLSNRYRRMASITFSGQLMHQALHLSQ